VQSPDLGAACDATRASATGAPARVASARGKVACSPAWPVCTRSHAAKRTIDEHADDVAELLDRLDIDAATIAGVSMGGYVALAMVARHPRRVRALVLADTRATDDSPEARAKRDENVAIAREQGLEALLDRVVPPLLGAHPLPELALRVRTIASSQPTGAVIDALHALRDRPDATPVLASIAVPTTVVVGAEDVLSPPAEGKRLADGIRGARFVLLDRAGHLSNLERPDAFEDAIRLTAT
jgi:3-oxoadipate enol-lactonase